MTHSTPTTTTPAANMTLQDQPVGIGRAKSGHDEILQTIGIRSSIGPSARSVRARRTTKSTVRSSTMSRWTT